MIKHYIDYINTVSHPMTLLRFISIARQQSMFNEKELQR